MILVGPLAAGKSTLGALVAERLGHPFVDIDDIAWPYCAEVGWTLDRLLERDEAVGWAAAEREWEPARAHAVQRTIADHPDAVIALGAGYTSFTSADHAQQVRLALAPIPDVIHLLPSPDPERSVTVLRERAIRSRGKDWIIEGDDWIARWVADTLAGEVAAATVFTDGMSPHESADQVVRLRERLLTGLAA
ncbi:shikimate kinase [Promicromonospora sp. AC04]|uniref:shikimate kinase n=1 Tax=Promicromonospora sp. AC04 TaxID=2135723 RepID=UPI000D3DBAD7|nr:shikimate kinase [Promicromonospora sp. AC04]PUB24486.1 shikimate kinase [Promicromonospora sp. AC04]